MIYEKSGLSLETTDDCITIRMSKHKTFLHLKRYIETYYGTKVNIVNSEANVIIFKNDEIDIFIQDYRNLELKFGYIIDNKLTYDQFINVFKDSFYMTKYEQYVYPVKTRSSKGVYIGVEIEVDIGKNKFCDLVGKIKDEYLDHMIAKTELDDNYNIIEFCVFPTPIENIDFLIGLIKHLYDDISIKSDRTNIHMHVTKEYFGATNNDIINNLKKLIYFDSNIDDVVQKMLLYGYSHNASSKSVVEEFNNSPIEYYDVRRKEYELNTDIRYYMHVNIYKLIHRQFNTNTVEFKWLALNEENYRNIDEYVNLFIYMISLISKPENEVKNITYNDFKKWYKDDKENRHTDK